MPMDMSPLFDVLAAPPAPARYADVARSVSDLLRQGPLAHAVIDATLHRSAAPAIVEHLADATWSRHYPLAWQAYSPLLAAGPALHQSLVTLQQASPWPRQSIEALHDALRRADAAAVTTWTANLQADITRIDGEAIALLEHLRTIRALKSQSRMHVMQAEAYLAATLVAGSLAGRACCDLGAGEGELVEYLQGVGATVEGSERKAGSFLGIDEEPRFDAVFATGFLEPGAFYWPGSGPDLAAFTDGADTLVAAAARLLRPGAILVVRNLNHPPAFSNAAVEAAGLTYQPLLLPLCMPHFGGRLAVWRRG